jgi:hypothetical protein
MSYIVLSVMLHISIAPYIYGAYVLLLKLFPLFVLFIKAAYQ